MLGNEVDASLASDAKLAAYMTDVGDIKYALPDEGPLHPSTQTSAYPPDGCGNCFRCFHYALVFRRS